MANYFQNAINSMGDWMGAKVAQYLADPLGYRGHILSRYYTGDHRPQLKMEAGRRDDNVIQNFIGLAVDRSNSRLWRGGVRFNLPEGSDKQQAYLDRIWDLNKKEILLFQAGLHGAYFGTAYFKILPDDIIDPYTGDMYPRLIALDPETVRIKTDSEDMNEVEYYKIEYTCKEMRDGREVSVTHKEITRHSDLGDYGSESAAETERETWIVEEWEQAGGMPWVMVNKYEWAYTFPPIIHWKNLPSLKSCYGDSEIDDVINVQDQSNFVVSNTGKIIKYYASPETIGTGFSVKDMQKFDAAVGSFHAIPNEAAKVYNLEMQSDLSSSRLFALDMRQSVFDIAREVDMSSMADKVGALTNFGLQVLWSDAIDKNDTKRQLYGDALLELNRRLLVLAGWEMMDGNPGTVQWGNAMPVNIMEEMTADQTALGMRVVDRETVAKRYQSRYGVDWETIQANMANEAAVSAAADNNIGAQILRNFNSGQ